MKAAGVLTRLSLAWSRDGDQKFYVQDRMREVGRDLWSWLADGAHVYVCGDAKRMAKDVERALVDIVAQHGARSANEAVAFVAELKKARPLPAGRLLMNALHAPARAAGAHDLPLLRRRLRRAGAAGRPGRRDHHRRSRPSGEFRQAVLEGLGARRDARPRRPAAASDAAAAPTARSRAPTGTPRSTSSPTASRASSSATGRTRSPSISPASC